MAIYYFFVALLAVRFIGGVPDIMPEAIIAMLPMAFTFGVIAIVFGIALMRLRKAMGRLAEYAGILEIIIGGTLITIVLAPVALVLSYPAGIIQIIILFKTIELIKQKEQEDKSALPLAGSFNQ